MGRGRLSALASLNQIFPSFSLLASENSLRPSSLRVCLKKKKEKEKVSNDLIVRAKTDDLKKKKKISRDYRASDDKNYINVCQLIELT